MLWVLFIALSFTHRALKCRRLSWRRHTLSRTRQCPRQGPAEGLTTELVRAACNGWAARGGRGSCREAAKWAEAAEADKRQAYCSWAVVAAQVLTSARKPVLGLVAAHDAVGAAAAAAAAGA